VIRTHCVNVIMNVGIVGYFSKPKWIREQKRLGNTVFEFLLKRGILFFS
jgi:hypothetical protein